MRQIGLAVSSIVAPFDSLAAELTKGWAPIGTPGGRDIH